MSAAEGNLSMFERERFMRFIIHEYSGCWMWMGAVSPRGYGEFSVQRRRVRAHRAAWIMHHGNVPAGYDLHHLCGNRRCCNPAHMACIPHTQHMAIHNAARRRKGAA